MSEALFGKYKKLDEIEHVLRRPGRYIGATTMHEMETYLIVDGQVKESTVKFCPAFLKLFDEVITNSVDFSKKPEGKHLNKIEVNINILTGEISVWDNGGIPVIMHPEYQQYIPDFIFGELRSGTNFDDDDVTIDTTGAGQNGEGSSLVNIFSERFIVETADGKNSYKRVYSNNNRDRSDIKVAKSSQSYTRISYIPDYKRLGIELDADHVNMLCRRVWEIAACAPKIEVKLNGSLVKCRSFEDFIKMFTSEAVVYKNDNWKLGFAPSKGAFKQISFINATNTYDGGTHIDYVMDIIVGKIRDHIEKKTKQKVMPAEIKNHFTLFVDATVLNPRYNSQTKEKLMTEVRNYGTKVEFDNKFIAKIIKSKIVTDIIEWAERKKEFEEAKLLRDKQKEGSKKSLKHITKYEPATEKVDRSKCQLFICEGDSASNPLISARDPRYHGVFPLKGKPINPRGKKVVELLKNEELFQLMDILGLEIGKVPDVTKLRYGGLVVSPDQDYDGYHVFTLVANLFHTLWPSLLNKPFLLKLETPIVKVEQGKGKQQLEFFSVSEFEDWVAKQTTKFQHTYLKGLGGNSTESFKRYMFDDRYKIPYTVETQQDVEALDIAFDQGDGAADRRKIWLYG